MKPDPNSPFVDDFHFEAEVRRIAKLIWPAAVHARSPMVDGLERDAIIQTEDLIFVVEATTSRKLDKIVNDGKKTAELVRKLRTQGFQAQGILITLNEPTADQEEAAKKHKATLSIKSFDEFLSRLFDAPQYLQSRLAQQFGSIKNPSTWHYELPRDFYIPLAIVAEDSEDTFSAESICEGICRHSARFAVLAEYGSGKSMALREVFFLLRDRYLKKEHNRFPLYINLRDHSGAKYPEEILERHARSVGLTNHQQLVNAWKAGFIDILLDGFDEFAASGWSLSAFKLRQVRHSMLEAVRKLVQASPLAVGIVIAGRRHYFDSTREMRDAIGLTSAFNILSIPILSEDDALRVVRRYGGNTAPQWIPGRALLLSYLAAKDLLKSNSELLYGAQSRGEGWDILLSMICEREASQHPALDGSQVQRFLERLATIARQTVDGLGSFSEEDLGRVFQEICGFPPDDAARVLINRLPAIGPASTDIGQRKFIDPDFTDAARSADVALYIQSPYDATLVDVFGGAMVSLMSNGLDRLSFIGERDLINSAKIELALEVAASTGLSPIAVDIMQLMMHWSMDYSRNRIDVHEVQFEGMSFENPIPNFARITFWSCLFDTLYVAPDIDRSKLPHFNQCLIGSLDGIPTKTDLPSEIFRDCDVLEVSDSLARNAGILNTDLPIAVKVLLTILNKLFFQAGSGRKENAFVRGLDGRAQRLVPQILSLVRSYGFATPMRIRNQTIWMPNRDKGQRARLILDKPTTSQDELLLRTKDF